MQLKVLRCCTFRGFSNTSKWGLVRTSFPLLYPAILIHWRPKTCPESVLLLGGRGLEKLSSLFHWHSNPDNRTSEDGYWNRGLPNGVTDRLSKHKRLKHLKCPGDEGCKIHIGIAWKGSFLSSWIPLLEDARFLKNDWSQDHIAFSPLNQ